jgi:hypothetical protein
MNTQTNFTFSTVGRVRFCAPHPAKNNHTRDRARISGVPQRHLAHCGLVGFRGRPKQWLLSSHSSARGCGRVSPFRVSMAAQRSTPRVRLRRACTVHSGRRSTLADLSASHTGDGSLHAIASLADMALALALLLAYISVTQQVVQSA